MVKGIKGVLISRNVTVIDIPDQSQEFYSLEG